MGSGGGGGKTEGQDTDAATAMETCLLPLHLHDSDKRESRSPKE